MKSLHRRAYYSEFEVILRNTSNNGEYLFRGTSEGFEGSESLLRVGVTPTSTNPAKAAVFATASQEYGNGVLHVASRNNLKRVTSVAGNVLAKAEEEVPLNMLPKQFASRAGLTITAQQAREVLKTMGIVIPSRITTGDITNILEKLPIMTQRQISNFVNQAQKLHT